MGCQAPVEYFREKIVEAGYPAMERVEYGASSLSFAKIWISGKGWSEIQTICFYLWLVPVLVKVFDRNVF